VAFSPTHNIYILKQGKGGATATGVAGSAGVFDDVTIRGALTVNGEAKFAGDVNVDANLTAQAATIVNDLTLSNGSTTYYGDPSTDGSFKLVIVNSQLRMYLRVSGAWVEQQAWGI
jgi:hypothetical protein